MLNSRQKEIVTGSLLGDGCVWTNFTKQPCKFSLIQSREDNAGMLKDSYMAWWIKEFMDVGCSVKPRKANSSGIVKEIVGDKTYHSYVFCTLGNALWTDIERKWYVRRTDHPWFKRRKIVPQDIKLTPLSLCVWHMEDGTNNPKDANIELETQSFTESEVEFLIERLKTDLALDVTKKKAAKKGQFKIYVGRKSYFEFLEIVKPHVEWDCFAYKIDSSAYNKEPHRGETHSLAKLTEEQVREMFVLKDGGASHDEIGAKLETSQANVSMILAGDHWSHLGLSRPVRRKPRITEKKKQNVVDLRCAGKNQNEIASMTNTTQTSVSRILAQVDILWIHLTKEKWELLGRTDYGQLVQAATIEEARQRPYHTSAALYNACEAGNKDLIEAYKFGLIEAGDIAEIKRYLAEGERAWPFSFRPPYIHTLFSVLQEIIIEKESR